MGDRRGDRGAEELVRTAKALLDRAEQAVFEDRLIGKVAIELAASLDYESTLQRVARLVVAGFADWCFVSVVDADGRVRDVGVAHANASKEELARSLLGNLPDLPSAPHGVSRVLRTLEAELHTSDSDAPTPLGHYLGAEYPDALRELGARSYICVPLIARDAALGALTYVRGPGSPPYSVDDLALAGELAQRSALAIDNARLHEAAAAAVKERDQLIALLSDDLRGVLQTMTQGMAALEKDPPACEDSIALMGRAATKLEALLADVAPAAVDVSPPTAPATAAAERATKTVFLADNDDAFRSALRDALAAHGFAVREVADGESALRLLGKTAEGQFLQPDVVDLDVRMPGCSGLGVLSAMKELPALPPTILISGFKDPSVAVVAERLGAHRVLYKPVAVDDVLVAAMEASHVAPRVSRRAPSSSVKG